jgi:dTDP-4-amino-4,6-dideoxygalactose transaminase
MHNFLPFAKPSITEDEINEVIHTLRSGWLTTGPQLNVLKMNLVNI